MAFQKVDLRLLADELNAEFSGDAAADVSGVTHDSRQARAGFLFTAISGLGGMIVEYANVFATAKLFVPIIVIAIVGVVLTELVMWLERRMSRWRQLERERF